MNLLNLGVLLAIPVFLFAQDSIAAGDQTHEGDTGGTTNLPANSAGSAASVPTPLTAGQKVTRRALRLVEPVTLFSSAFGAGIDQLRNEPSAWGQGSEGYARRFASAEGFTAAHNTIALGFDLAFHLDPRYHRMPGAGFKPRLWSAISQTFIANKDSGGKTVNVSEIFGNFGAGFVSNTWQPAGERSTSDALTRGAFGILYHSAKNVLREFLPDILHPGRRQSYIDQGLGLGIGSE